VGFGFYPALPDCKLIERFPGYFAMDDVSKNHGVACDGDGCPQTQKDPQRLDRVEMNVEFGHYSMVPFLFLRGRAIADGYQHSLV
jgi:hypothetical protein